MYDQIFVQKLDETYCMIKFSSKNLMKHIV